MELNWCSHGKYGGIPIIPVQREKGQIDPLYGCAYTLGKQL